MKEMRAVAMLSTVLGCCGLTAQNPSKPVTTLRIQVVVEPASVTKTPAAKNIDPVFLLRPEPLPFETHKVITDIPGGNRETRAVLETTVVLPR